MTRAGSPRRLILWTIAMSLGGIVLLAGLYLARDVLVLLYASVILAIGCSPIVGWIERHPIGGRWRVPRWAAILLLYAAAFAVFAAILTIVLGPFIGQARALWQNLPAYVEQAQQFLIKRGVLAHEWSFTDLVANAPSPGAAVTGVVVALRTIFEAVAAVVTILLLAFYLLLDAASLRDAMLHLFARDTRPRVARLTGEVTAKVGAWIVGQLTLVATITVTTGVGLWVLGVPYFYVLALVAGLGEFVPMIGPIAGAIPALAVAGTVSFTRVAIVAGYFWLQQTLENQVLVPRIMQRQVGVSPVVVIAAVLTGATVFGAPGALLAVPTAAIVQIFVKEYFTPGRDTASDKMPDA